MDQLIEAEHHPENMILTSRGPFVIGVRLQPIGMIVDEKLRDQQDHDGAQIGAQYEQRRNGADDMRSGVRNYCEIGVDSLLPRLGLRLQHEIAEKMLELECQQSPQEGAAGDAQERPSKSPDNEIALNMRRVGAIYST